MTKDADKMLCCLYKEYLERVKHGLSKRESKCFTDEFFSSDDSFSDWHEDDIAMVKSELNKLHLIKMDIIGNLEFTDSGISYMQDRFKNGLKELADFITKFIP